MTRIVIGIIIGIIAQLAVRYGMDGTPAEGFIAYMCGYIIGLLADEKEAK